MNSSLPPSSTPKLEFNVKSILEWLALVHGRTGVEDAEPLYRQLLLLREAPIPPAQRTKLLDLLYGQAVVIVHAVLPQLHEVALPISRKLRQRVKLLLDLLETLTQDYLNTLAELFDPDSHPNRAHTARTSLRRTMLAIAWQIRINHLVASPTGIGLWQQLHAAFRTAHRLGLEKIPAERNGPSIQRTYANVLLTAIAQPASFSSAELEFINEYVEQSPLSLEFLSSPPSDSQGTFWIDLDRDFSAHALVRRTPGTDTQVLYFSCDAIAQSAKQHFSDLANGASASSLGLPIFAETHAGKGVLQRLHGLWGHPTKRRFPRRRQSYRANLCAGLEKLCGLIKSPEEPADLSEWMVTNESPDGYALMHMSGHTGHLRVGDVIALQPLGERAEATPVWHVCVIRWAISENPEHIELGLQLLAPWATAAEIAQPNGQASGSISALILPKTPPLRQSESLVVAAGTLTEAVQKIVILVEKENLEIRSVRATRLDERTSSIEVFSVLPDDSP